MIKPILDNEFRPAALENRAFLQEVKNSGGGVPLVIALERTGGFVSRFETRVFPDGHSKDPQNLQYAERLVKTLLWARGGYKIIVGGPARVGEHIRQAFSAEGARSFDYHFMTRVYERPLTVVAVAPSDVPASHESPLLIGRHLNGCRIGFDAGGSDRKVSAVVNGKVVYSEETVWHPKLHDDPDYHFNGILHAFRSAAAKMPSVDGIGVSAAGIYVDNRTMVASLFLKVPQDKFDIKVKDIFLNAAAEMGNVPISVCNDGDVAALAGSMHLNKNNVLGIAMGTSEAAGYVNSTGSITGWLNELAFVPIDYNEYAVIDEWSGDLGCGGKYFSQDAVIRLAPSAGIELESDMSPAEKLKAVQELFKSGHTGAKLIFETIGTYFGYAIAHYSDFYDIDYLQLLGRVASGDGGNIIIENANRVLNKEFPLLARKIKLYIPDEYERRVGQSIAAASLPEVKKAQRE